MGVNKHFVDSNLFIYLLSTDDHKAKQVEILLQKSNVISVQVLNEIANVSRKKFKLSWSEINEFIDLIKNLCTVFPLTTETQSLGLAIAERYCLSVYDAMIIASAQLSKCTVLFSEDMQNGLVIKDVLSNRILNICNPFN